MAEEANESLKHWFCTTARLLVRGKLDNEIAGEFKHPSPLIATGFNEVTPGRSWEKAVIDPEGVSLKMTVDYYPDSRTWIQRPGIEGAAGQTISRWGATVFNENVATVRDDEAVVHQAMIRQQLDELFDIVVGKSGLDLV